MTRSTKTIWHNIKHFTKDEFTCKCGCGTNNVNSIFVKKLDIARRYAEMIDPEQCEFYINSGCRCKNHNTAVGGHPNSRHIASESKESSAADIKVLNNHHKSVVLTALIKAEFKHIGIADNFIHVDDKEEYTIWLY